MRICAARCRLDAERRLTADAGAPGFGIAFVEAAINPAVGMLGIVALVALYLLPSSSGA